MLLLTVVAAAFIFELLCRQDRRTLAGPQLLFFNRYLVIFLSHEKHSSNDKVQMTNANDSGMLHVSSIIIKCPEL